MKWLEKIKESENINQLPLYKDLEQYMTEGEEEFLHEEWQDNSFKKFTIKDGTEIQLECSNDCFNDSNWTLQYYIIDTEIYICAECGLWQKQYHIDETGEDLVLPYNWEENGVKVYIQRRIQYHLDYKAKKEREEQQRIEQMNEAYNSDFKECRLCDECEHRTMTGCSRGGDWENDEYCSMFELEYIN